MDKFFLGIISKYISRATRLFRREFSRTRIILWTKCSYKSDFIESIWQACNILVYYSTAIPSFCHCTILRAKCLSLLIRFRGSPTSRITCVKSCISNTACIIFANELISIVDKCLKSRNTCDAAVTKVCCVCCGLTILIGLDGSIVLALSEELPYGGCGFIISRAKSLHTITCSRTIITKIATIGRAELIAITRGNQRNVASSLITIAVRCTKSKVCIVDFVPHDVFQFINTIGNIDSFKAETAHFLNSSLSTPVGTLANELSSTSILNPVHGTVCQLGLNTQADHRG